MLLDKLRIDLTESVKARNHERAETLRYLLAGIRNAAIYKYGAPGELSLTNDDIIAVIRKQVKSHKESIDAYTKGERIDLVSKEQAQLAILESYLPRDLNDDEIRLILEPIAKSGESNFGLIMKQAMAAVAGRADGSRVSAILKKLLNG